MANHFKRGLVCDAADLDDADRLKPVALESIRGLFFIYL